MGNETIVTNCNEFANERVGLYPAPLTDCCAFLNLDEWTNEAASSNGATIQIDRLHNPHVFSEGDIDDAGIKDFWRGHHAITYRRSANGLTRAVHVLARSASYAVKRFLPTMLHCNSPSTRRRPYAPICLRSSGCPMS